MDEQGKIYWHEPFFEGLQLVLNSYDELLDFESEHPLSKEALIVDVIVKKKKNAPINKDIAKIFRGYNLFEFKSEKDSLSVRDYDKVVSYARLYSSFENVPISDITVSFAFTMFPRELVKHLREERQFTVLDMGDGIYYIEGDTFPIQLLESKNLSKENLLLRNLRSNLSEEEFNDTLNAYKNYQPLNNKSIYLNRLFQANLEVFKEAMKMVEELREIFLETADEEGWLDSRIDSKVIQEVIQDRKNMAKKLLLRGDTVEDVVTLTELPYDTVANLVV